MNQFLKFYLGLTVILFGSFCLGLGAAAENNFKLGVVDTQRVFENFAKAQEANEILQNCPRQVDKSTQRHPATNRHDGGTTGEAETVS